MIEKKTAKYKDLWLNCYYKDNHFHRDDGPAIEFSNGIKQWYIHGVQYTEEEFNFYLEQKKLNHELEHDLNHKEQQTQFKI